MKSHLLMEKLASWGHFVFSLIAAVFSFDASVSWKGFVVFMMQSQDKATSHGRSTEQIHSLAYQLTKTQQLISLETQKLTNLKTQKPINSKPYQLANSSAHQLRNTSTYNLINSSTYKLINSPTYKLINLQTYQLTNLETHQLTASSSHQLRNSKPPKTQTLKC